MDIWKIIPKISWFCSLTILCLRITKHAKKSRNRLARHKVTKLTSEFSLHEPSWARRHHWPPFLALLFSILFSSECTSLLQSIQKYLEHIVSNAEKKILIINIFLKFKSPYCMIISFIIQENEIFTYKIIHIPVLFTYVKFVFSKKTTKINEVFTNDLTLTT